MNLAISCSTLGLLLVAGWAAAQPVYRSVDANGKVSFSDQLAISSGASAAKATTTVSNADTANESLPYEVRQIAERYPVTIYTGTDCAPCLAGRSLLVTRGIPFSERTVTTREDSESLQNLSGQRSLPLLGVGTQLLKGFSDVEWSQYLDAAGYPPSSLLPARYRNPPASPLVVLQAVPVPALKSNPARLPAPRAVPGAAPNPNNPAGIRF